MKNLTTINSIAQRNEQTNNNIKAITNRVNDRISLIFNGKIKDIYGLHDAVVFGINGKGNGRVIRAWNDLGKTHPGLRDLLFNQPKNNV